jgi:hypothetical protein
LGLSPQVREVSRESGQGNKGSQSQKDPFTESRPSPGKLKSGYQRVVIHEGIPDIRLLARGATMTMDNVSIGDAVKVRPKAFFKVLLLSHKMHAGEHDIFKLATATGPSISFTCGHYFSIDVAVVAEPQMAVGANVQLVNGAEDKFASISTVRETGLYDPQTLQVDIVVTDVFASAYTAAVAPQISQAVLAPLRAFFEIFDLESSSLESGGGYLAAMVLLGQNVFKTNSDMEACNVVRPPLLMQRDGIMSHCRDIGNAKVKI